MPMDWIEPNVCLDENLTTDASGLLRMQPWSVPRLVADVKAISTGDGKLLQSYAISPGKLMMNQKISWRNNTPLDRLMTIRVIRAYRSWVTSNPNAIQVRDRWSYAIDTDPAVPTTTGIVNSQAGSALDVGSNTVAEPNPGRQWMWSPANMMDEEVGPLSPDQRLNVHYRCYMWTPPPWSDNANKNGPEHEMYVRWTRIQLWAHPQQGNLVIG